MGPVHEPAIHARSATVVVGAPVVPVAEGSAPDAAISAIPATSDRESESVRFICDLAESDSLVVVESSPLYRRGAFAPHVPHHVNNVDRQ